MTFLAPVPWEADAFYAQPGMAERGLTLDTWPVGTGPYMMTEFVQGPPPRDEAQPQLPRRALSLRRHARRQGGRPAGRLRQDHALHRHASSPPSSARRCRSAASSARATTTSRSSSAPTPAWTTWSTCRTPKRCAREYLDKGFRLPAGRRRQQLVHRLQHARPGDRLGRHARAAASATASCARRISIAIDWEEYSQDLPEEGRRDRAWARCRGASSARARARPRASTR